VFPAVAAITVASCVHPTAPLSPRPSTSDAALPLHGHGLTLHLSRPGGGTPELPARHARPPVLLVYATGDAGWWGKDRDIFAHMKTWGYPAVGFSAREYVHHLGQPAVGLDVVARDYAAIVSAAVAELALPASTRAVLVGKSRGAGLAIAAAGGFPQQPGLAGVLAVGLTREEEYVQRHSSGPGPPRPAEMLQTYDALPALGEIPVAVIQSTRDDYVPAAEARRLFGPDTPSRELLPIAAADHNFGGALDQLYAQMERSLEWIVAR
jgi:virulence protein VirJ